MAPPTLSFLGGPAGVAWAWLGLALCLVLMALFAASEAALAATNRVRLRHLLRAPAATAPGATDDANAAHLVASELSSEAQSFLATVTIAANVPMLGAAALTVWLARAYFLAPATIGIVCAAAALASIVLLQVTPRLLVSRPGALARLWWLRPARLLVAWLRPPVACLLWLGNALLHPLLSIAAPASTGVHGDTQEEPPAPGLENADDLRDLVESAHASGWIEAGGRELIESIFTFGDTRVHEVMIPRPDILSLPVEASAEVVLDTLQESGFSRIPLHQGSVDHVAGILHAKDVLACLSHDQWDFVPRDLMRPPLFVPESSKIDLAFAAMRAQRNHLAIAIDEFGGTAGLLTIEDILEELVGDIADEHDKQVEDALAILDANTALADALLHTDDLEQLWKLQLPTGEFDTVGGFMIEQLGRAPVLGDRVELPEATLTVHAMRGRRPCKIMIVRHPGPAPREDGDQPETG